jgi:hypothetical protein
LASTAGLKLNKFSPGNHHLPHLAHLNTFKLIGTCSPVYFAKSKPSAGQVPDPPDKKLVPTDIRLQETISAAVRLFAVFASSQKPPHLKHLITDPLEVGTSMILDPQSGQFIFYFVEK